MKTEINFKDLSELEKELYKLDCIGFEWTFNKKVIRELEK